MDKDKVNERVWFREWAQVLDSESVDQKKLKLYCHTILGSILWIRPTAGAKSRD